ncbi:MAG: fumarate hydratase, partial [Actinobacteria bacterium]|nr:fumarate hydratase [Actinomycetota bacterium]
MKTIKIIKIKNLLRKLINRASFNLPDDILKAVLDALACEKNETARKILKLIIENAETAAVESVPLCQDCGTVYVEILIGKNTCIENFNEIDNAVNEVVAQVYTESYLRKSIVSDPLFDRKNTFTNTPAIISYGKIQDSVEGVEIKVFLKGAGSDNCSYLYMMNPSSTPEEITAVVKDLVIKNATKSCPPLIIGIGIGSSASGVTELARKAAFREIGTGSPDERYKNLENIILNEVNSTGIGPAGLGGNTTALAVNIEYAPCHMA